MTESINTEEVIELVEKAQAKGSFDITAFAKGRAYPEEKVTTFLDVQSAYKLNKLNEQMRTTSDPEELEKLETQASALVDSIKKSQVTFYMRGVNQASIEKITLDCDAKFPPQRDAFGQQKQDTEWLREWTCALVASNLYKTENANGEIDEAEFTVERVNDLRYHLPKEVWDLLVDTMQKLTLATAYFEGMTDAGFLQKS